MTTSAEAVAQATSSIDKVLPLPKVDTEDVKAAKAAKAVKAVNSSASKVFRLEVA